jgi:hypothetical protein
VNFNDLRLTVKLSGTNVERVRVGMPAKIKVTPDYGLGCVVRADTKLGWFESARLQFNYVLDGKEVKSFLLDWWKRHPVVSPDDTKQSVALTPTEVEECEVVCALRTDALSPAEAAKVPETFYLEVDPIASENPVHGIVIEGKHTGTYTTNYLDPPVREELKRRLMEAVKGKEAQPKGKAGEPVLRIEGVNSIHTYLKIKAAVADITLEESKRAKEKDKGKEQKKIPVAIMDQRVVADGEWRLRRAGMDERFALAAATGIEVDRGDRFFEGSVRIDSPSSDLVMKVKEAYQKSPAAYLKAKVEVVVGECRLAMLLFRQ